MNINRTHSATVRISWIFLVLLCLVAALRAAEPALAVDSEAVVAFKRYLATPPCYSRILYSTADCSNNVLRSYYAACCGDNYVYRQLTGFENIDLPVSHTNRNHSPIFGGRLGDTHWAVSGYTLNIDLQPAPGRPPPDGSLHVYLNQLLSFGSQHVQAGTFVWQGNHFEAQASRFSQELGVSGIFTGEIFVEAGRVKRMVVKGSGIWDYGYDNSSTNIPKGLPTTITQVKQDGRCVSRFIIQRMTPGDRTGDSALFDPKRQIDPQITILQVVSNGIETVTGAQNPLVKQITEEELGPLARKEIARRSRIQKAVLWSVFTPSIGLALWLLWKKHRAVK